MKGKIFILETRDVAFCYKVKSCFEVRLEPGESGRSWESRLPPSPPSSSNALWSRSPSVGLPAAAKLHSYKGVIISRLYCHRIHQPINQQTLLLQSQVSPPLPVPRKRCGFRFTADWATTPLWSPVWCSFNFNAAGVDCKVWKPQQMGQRLRERGWGTYLKNPPRYTSTTSSIPPENK